MYWLSIKASIVVIELCFKIEEKISSQVIPSLMSTHFCYKMFLECFPSKPSKPFKTFQAPPPINFFTSNKLGGYYVLTKTKTLQNHSNQTPFVLFAIYFLLLKVLLSSLLPSKLPNKTLNTHFDVPRKLKKLSCFNFL